MATVGTSGTSYNSIYNTNSRLTGMFSNLDTDALVKSMCSTQQARIDKVKQQLTRQEWLSDSMTGVQSEVNDFLNEYLSSTGSNSLLKASTYTTFKAVTSSTSNSVSVTPTSSAETCNISVKVNQLAKNASTESAAKVSSSGKEISSNNSAKLTDLQLAKSLKFGTDGNISFAINGKTFKFDKETTLQSMINTINSDTTANVTMKYSRLSDTFSITADSGGADSSVSITNLSGNAFGENSAFGINTGVSNNGKDAEAVISYNGKDSTITRDSNTFSIDGVSYELKSVTANTSEEKVEFSLEHDYSNSTDTVSKFVDAYNTLYKKLTSLLSEKDYSADYPPLTDDQREELSDDQIKAWEKKAKSGLLRNNTQLSNLISNLHNAFYSALGGTGKNASEIGITTAGYYESNAGQLVLDEDKLKEALKNTPDTVIKMFTNGSSTSTSSEQGLAYKLRSSMTKYTSILTDALETGSDQLDKYDTQIDDMEDKLADLADRYYTKFSRMETALSKLNAQTSMISQMFSGS